MLTICKIRKQLFIVNSDRFPNVDFSKLDKEKIIKEKCILNLKEGSKTVRLLFFTGKL